VIFDIFREVAWNVGGRVAIDGNENDISTIAEFEAVVETLLDVMFQHFENVGSK